VINPRGNVVVAMEKFDGLLIVVLPIACRGIGPSKLVRFLFGGLSATSLKDFRYPAVCSDSSPLSHDVSSVVAKFREATSIASLSGSGRERMWAIDCTTVFVKLGP
jgi:hypothetical protein